MEYPEVPRDRDRWIVQGTGGDGLLVREEPSTTGAVLSRLAEGDHVKAICQGKGSVVNGSDVWDEVEVEAGLLVPSCRSRKEPRQQSRCA